jgi:hypothetical protein
MRDDGALVARLKQQRYHNTITLDQYDAALAPIRARHGWVFEFWSIHWLYYTQILLVTTALLMIVLSLLTRPPEPGALRFTWYGGDAAGAGGDTRELEHGGCTAEPRSACCGARVLHYVLVNGRASRRRP